MEDTIVQLMYVKIGPGVQNNMVILGQFYPYEKYRVSKNIQLESVPMLQTPKLPAIKMYLPILKAVEN